MSAAGIAEPQEKKVVVNWEEDSVNKSLSLIRGPRADGEIRDHIRIVPGPQPYRHNHYNDEDFYQHNPKTGVVTNVYGQRIVRVTEDFMVACLGALEEELGEAAGEVMYKIGYQWGTEDMKTFLNRAKAEFEVDLSKMGMGFMLETWWWPLTIEGWGTWRYDFRQAKQGLLFIDLYESAVAQSLGNIGKVVCYFYAGLFASVFSTLSSRALDSIEIQCYSMGDDYCKFLVSTSKRVNAASFWRNEGASSKEIMQKAAQLD